jgi:hypothetical protein
MYASEAESPKLAEARAAMMAMLSQGQSSTEESEPPAKPSSLEWPEPPPPRRPTPTEVHAQPSAKPQPASAPNQPAAGPSGKAPPPPVPRKPPVPPRAR